MVKKIIAVLIGIVISFLLGIASTSDFWPFPGLLGMISRNIIPCLIGGVITGYIAVRRGWLLGMLVGGIVEVFGLLVLMSLANSAGLRMRDYFSVWWWLSQLSPLFFGGLGGYFGEIFANKIRSHRRT
jgi:hypothetical protein